MNTQSLLQSITNGIPAYVVLAPAILLVSTRYGLARVRRWGAGTAYTWAGLVVALWAGWVAFYFRADSYEPPHVCVSLQCWHTPVTTPDGKQYCSKFPPKAILDADISPTERVLRRYSGTFCVFFALGLSAYAFGAGIAVLVRGGRSRVAKSRYVLELASLPVAFGFLQLSIGLLAIYPLPPL